MHLGIRYNNDGWLYVSHERHRQQGHFHGTYIHRFVHLGADFSLRAISAPFYFHPHEPSNDARSVIEFCSGLTRDTLNGKLVISFGDQDAEAFLATIDEKEVARLLVSPADLMQDRVPEPLAI